jgi:hypothetical protein
MRCGRSESGGARADTRERGERGRLARGGKTEQTRDEETPARCRGFSWGQGRSRAVNRGGKGQQTTQSGHTRVQAECPVRLSKLPVNNLKGATPASCWLPLRFGVAASEF